MLGCWKAAPRQLVLVSGESPLRSGGPFHKHLMLLCAALAVAGCSLPRSGPTASEFVRANEASQIQLVDATAQDAALSRVGEATTFPESWRDAPAPVLDRIGKGDILRVAIYEQDGLGLFGGGRGGATVLEAVPVDSSGQIQLPFVGSIRAAGLTPAETRNQIFRRLRGLVASADVQVSFAERHSQTVSVQGDVGKSGTVPLNPETRRLSALVSAAAPSAEAQQQALVTLRRGEQVATVRLADLENNASQDIFLYPGDVVTVRALRQAVTVLGSAGVQGRVRINKPTFTVLDALAESRGLNTDSANPSAVYLMKLSDPAEVNAAVPKVYRFDFRNPVQLAVAGQFVVRDGDVLYVSTAPFAQTRSLLSIFTGVLNSARAVSVVAP